MAQSVKHPTSAQVMISRFMNSSPTSGSVLTAQSLEPASDSVSPSVSALPTLVLSLCLSKINKSKKIFLLIFSLRKFNSISWFTVDVPTRYTFSNEEQKAKECTLSTFVLCQK